MLTIDEIKTAVAPICEKYGVARMTLFGSYARGEADEKSDVDLLVDDGDSPKLRGFAFFKLYDDIQDTLGLEIDLVSVNGAGKRFLNAISKDEVLIYERQAS